jgi:N-acetylmuramoyl-L-alanine amidase
MFNRALRFLTIIFLFALQFVHAQPQYTSTSVRMALSQADTTILQCFEYSNVTYIPLPSLLKRLSLPYVINDTTKKIEFLAGDFLVRFAENNAFAVLTERKTNSITVYQMPQNAIRIDDVFYAPMPQVLTFLQQTVQIQLLYSKEKRSLELAVTESPFDITGYTVEQKANGYLLTLTASRRIKEVESWLKPDGWLFITITNATADTQKILQTPLKAPVKKILTFQSPSSVQLTFKLSPDVEQAEVLNDPTSTNLLISLRTKSPAAIPQPKPQKDLSKERERWKLDVIVIDPGHGGKDPGAIGIRGTYEKDITLAVALKLGELIKRNMPDVKVVYTRKTDTFVELYRRTQIANEAGGKLFISLHCNSMERRPSSQNGFEIYLLRPGKTEEAIEIAAKENAVIKFEENYQERYRELTEEEFIIITMAQSAYMKHSELYASIASETLSNRLHIKNGGVKQAGFFVLVGASMPNVLVELGYLSNRAEEEFLRSEQGQRQLASALFESIRRYKEEYEQTLSR